MDISRSTYYYKPGEKLSGVAELRDRIEKIAYKYPYYGYRRMTHALKRDGIKINHKKVLKIMKEMGIQCKKARKFAVTTNSSHKLK
ncbi:unnamed protein product, partial [marine sediment metagenome]